MDINQLTAAEKSQIFAPVRARADRIIIIALIAYFMFGVFLSFFYDTYSIAVGVGGLLVGAWFVTQRLLPNSNLYQYVLGAVLAVFTAQFIYQMHGLFEMHFFVFVSSTLLIAYQNWRLQLPLILVVVAHHGLFAYLQFAGSKEIYFTQLEYMDMQTFLFHGGLAAVIVGICGFWAFEMEKQTLTESLQKSALEAQLRTVTGNIAFAEQISAGNLGVDYELKDENDELGRALITMRNNLAAAAKKEQEEKFITIGITQVGDVIRKHANSVQNLADDFIRTLVKYMNMNQGGLFLLEGENENQHLRLAACYAFERKKYLSKSVAIGEGLVGQCFLERDIIYMTKVPNDYVHITSGLGGATPSCVILVPVMTADEIVGVLELASFKPLENYRIEFLQKAAENIASSIVSSRVTERVRLLLSESQQQTEEMRAQEEEMRQNMEELAATQEEMQRKSFELDRRMDAVDKSWLATIEFDLGGYVLTANEIFANLMGYRVDELRGQHHRIFVKTEEAQSPAYRQFWEALAAGKNQIGNFERKRKDGTPVFISANYAVLRDMNGNPERVVKFATDISRFVNAAGGSLG